MKVVRVTEGETYNALDHYNMWGSKKITEEVSQKTTVSLSHFLPNGGAKMASSSRERVYYIITGSITVTGEEDEFVLNSGDVIYIAAGEKREVSVNNNEPSTVLVVVITTT